MSAPAKGQSHRRAIAIAAYTALLCTGCDSERVAPQPSASKTAESQPTAPDVEAMALTGFARNTLARRVGIDVIFEPTTTSITATGRAVCGSFTRVYQPGIGYYIATPGKVDFRWNQPYPTEWKEFCAINGKAH